MTTWVDRSFNYRGFKCIWNHNKNHFEIREYGSSVFMGHAVDEERAKKIIDREIGK